MIEGGDRSSLALKPLEAIRIGSQLFGQHLESHIAPQLGVFGPINFAHAAFTQLGSDLEMGEGGADQGLEILSLDVAEPYGGTSFASELLSGAGEALAYDESSLW